MKTDLDYLLAGLSRLIEDDRQADHQALEIYARLLIAKDKGLVVNLVMSDPIPIRSLP